MTHANSKESGRTGFNRYDEPRLKKALKRVADKRAFQRVQAVRLVAQGRAISEIAEMVGVSVQAVYNWVNYYLDRHRGAALEDAVRSGRPRIVKRITAARMLRELRRNPRRLGYRTTVWTVKLLAAHLIDFTNVPSALTRGGGG